MDNVEATLKSWIDADREALIGFLQRFIAIPSPNPPGDTRAAAEFVRETLASEGVPVKLLSAREEIPNVVGGFDCASGGQHLILNGHLDVFPVGEDEVWTEAPWSGARAKDAVWGRGAVDMKCGTAASIWTYIYLHRLKDRLRGRLTLTAVSDEETGGTYGSKWLVEDFGAEFRGDCCLNGEPSTPALIRFGEKGTLRVVFEVETPGAHAAYTYASPNAIRIASEIIRDLYTLEDVSFEQPDELRRIVESSMPAMDRALGAGAGSILNKVTVSVGVIQGGLKINVLPGKCRFEVDFRLPIGTTSALLRGRIARIVDAYPGAVHRVVESHSSEPSWCDPKARMVPILQDIAETLLGSRPIPTVSLGASDAKFWRRRNIPAFLYGCSPTNMAKPNEHVPIAEYLHIVKSHVLSAARFLAF